MSAQFAVHVVVITLLLLLGGVWGVLPSSVTADIYRKFYITFPYATSYGAPVRVGFVRDGSLDCTGAVMELVGSSNSFYIYDAFHVDFSPPGNFKVCTSIGDNEADLFVDATFQDLSGSFSGFFEEASGKLSIHWTSAVNSTFAGSLLRLTLPFGATASVDSIPEPQKLASNNAIFSFDLIEGLAEAEMKIDTNITQIFMPDGIMSVSVTIGGVDVSRWWAKNNIVFGKQLSKLNLGASTVTVPHIFSGVSPPPYVELVDRKVLISLLGSSNPFMENVSLPSVSSAVMNVLIPSGGTTLYVQRSCTVPAGYECTLSAPTTSGTVTTTCASSLCTHSVPGGSADDIPQVSLTITTSGREVRAAQSPGAGLETIITNKGNFLVNSLALVFAPKEFLITFDPISTLVLSPTPSVVLKVSLPHGRPWANDDGIVKITGLSVTGGFTLETEHLTFNANETEKEVELSFNRNGASSPAVLSTIVGTIEVDGVQAYMNDNGYVGRLEMNHDVTFADSLPAVAEAVLSLQQILTLRFEWATARGTPVWLALTTTGSCDDLSSSDFVVIGSEGVEAYMYDVSTIDQTGTYDICTRQGNDSVMFKQAGITLGGDWSGSLALSDAGHVEFQWSTHASASLGSRSITVTLPEGTIVRKGGVRTVLNAANNSWTVSASTGKAITDLEAIYLVPDNGDWAITVDGGSINHWFMHEWASLGQNLETLRAGGGPTSIPPPLSTEKYLLTGVGTAIVPVLMGNQSEVPITDVQMPSISTPVLALHDEGARFLVRRRCVVPAGFSCTMEAFSPVQPTVSTQAVTTSCTGTDCVMSIPTGQTDALPFITVSIRNGSSATLPSRLNTLQIDSFLEASGKLLSSMSIELFGRAFPVLFTPEKTALEAGSTVIVTISINRQLDKGETVIVKNINVPSGISISASELFFSGTVLSRTVVLTHTVDSAVSISQISGTLATSAIRYSGSFVPEFVLSSTINFSAKPQPPNPNPPGKESGIFGTVLIVIGVFVAIAALGVGGFFGFKVLKERLDYKADERRKQKATLMMLGGGRGTPTAPPSLSRGMGRAPGTPPSSSPPVSLGRGMPLRGGPPSLRGIPRASVPPRRGPPRSITGGPPRSIGNGPPSIGRGVPPGSLRGRSMRGGSLTGRGSPRGMSLRSMRGGPPV